jgi:hypothetical protein
MPGDDRLAADYAEAINRATKREDVILTDVNEKGRGFALPWYADRAIIPFDNETKDPVDTRTVKGIADLRGKYPGRRVYYLLSDQAPKELAEAIAKTYPKRDAGKARLFAVDESTTAAPATAPTVPK